MTRRTSTRRSSKRRSSRRLRANAIAIQMVPVASVIATEHTPLHEAVVRSAELAIMQGWDLNKVPPVAGLFSSERDDSGQRHETVHVHDGHHRVEAARRLGMKEIPVVNWDALKTGEKASYKAAVRRYRKLIEHPQST